MPLASELASLARAIAPERAAELRARLAERLAGDALDVAVLLATAYPALSAVLEASPELAEDLAAEGHHGARERYTLLERLRASAASSASDATVPRALRRFARYERTRIALREILPPSLGGAEVDSTGPELTYLAEATIAVALDEAVRRTAERFGSALTASGESSRFVVLGMGKLGGEELNPGSDVDLVYFYDTDEGEATGPGGSISLHDYWSRVARRLTALLDEVTEDGFVWRVDLRLRPEGRGGPLVNSLAAAERYYESFGRLWERAALARARPVAGDPRLGDELLSLLAPFIWRKAVDPTIAVSMSQLVERSRAELGDAAGRDVKLGKGGIREAEFFVQTLQLVWGGREPRIRAPGTLDGLRRLRALGLVTDREGRDIAEGYLALRRVEHAVQTATGLQTHAMPAEVEALNHLARALGHGEAASFAADIARRRARVASRFASLLPRGAPPPSRWTDALAALDRGDVSAFNAALVRAAQAAQGITAPAAIPPPGPDTERWDEVCGHLLELARHPYGPLGARSREMFPTMAETLLAAVVDAAGPEQAARYLRIFFARAPQRGVYLKLLGDDPRALRRFVGALGASAFLGDVVVYNPELGDTVLFARPVPSPEEIRAETMIDAATTGAGEDPQEALVGALRRHKAQITIEVALADLAGELGPRETTLALTELADASLEAATRFALGTPEGAPTVGLSVIAMGKLGGREIGYGSDLDVIFLFDEAAAPAKVDPNVYFTRCARRIISLISVSHPAGPGYELDTRLRPSGSQGLLVTSLGAFARYHGCRFDDGEAPAARHVRAAAWERLALLRARPAAGDVRLGAEAIRIAHEAAYGEQSARPAELAAEVRRLRERIERELSLERRGRHDFKLGPGGLLELELSVQLLQLVHGRDPGVRTSETLVAIEALAAAGHLSLERADTLRDGYAFLRKLEQRVRIVHADASQLLEEDAPGLAPLARRMGIRDRPGQAAAAELLARFLSVTRRVRATFEALVAELSTDPGA